MNQDDHAVIKWGRDVLLSLGYVLENELPQTVQETLWSHVVRFDTSKGYIYLKQTPELIALEPMITQMLNDEFHAAVPEIIAHNEKLHCFLMKDVGRPLREILKKNFDTTLLCRAIEKFTSLQHAVVDHVDVFLDMGVPDWRLDRLPDLYKQLLSEKEILIADGLSESYIATLESLIPEVTHYCEILSAYPIKQTIVQCDFHDNNILVDEKTQEITFIDLGEVVISHPFFSLVGCLWQAKRHHGLTDEDDTYSQLIEACLKNYMNIESEKHLIHAFATASILWGVYEVLAQYRLMFACGVDRLISFQRGKLSNAFKEFMAACTEAHLR